MKIVHISDTHGYKGHEPLRIPECDVVICTGDIAPGATKPAHLTEFLTWFERLPAKKKIFVAGNHDVCLDPNKAFEHKRDGRYIEWLLQLQDHQNSVELLKNFDVTYLLNTGCEFEGVFFWGSPYSPSFNRHKWGFNADRGEEISKHWAQIPENVEVLLTHCPPYGVLDKVDKKFVNPGENLHVGCEDLLRVIEKRLFRLKLCCYGHIHDNYGIISYKISNKRSIMCSNAAIVNHKSSHVTLQPFIINI